MMNKVNKVKIISLTRTKTFPYLEFRGETDNCYIVFRYFNNFISFGVDERELKAEISMKQYSTNGPFSLKQMIESFGFDCSMLDFEFILA